MRLHVRPPASDQAGEGSVCRCRARWAFLTALAVAAATLFVRATAPSNFHSKDQPKTGMYVIDMLDNGRWFLPRAFDEGVELTTKPPLIAWIGAGLSAAAGRVSVPLLQASAGLSYLLTVGLTFWIGARLSSRRVAALAAVISALTYHLLNHAWIFRPDMPLVLTVWAAVAAFVGLEQAPAERRAPWRLALWGATGLAMLDKGPIGLLAIAAVVVVDLAWRRRLGQLRGLLWPWWGLLGALGVMGLWLLLALLAGGREFWDEVVYSEFLQRIWGGGERAGRARGPLYYLPYILGRMAPWSAVIVLAAPLLWRSRRERGPRTRPLLWAGALFAALSVPTSKRADYTLPIYPALALVIAQLLVGWQAQFRRVGRPPLAWRLWAATVGTAGIGLALALLTMLLIGRSFATPPAPDVETRWPLIAHQMLVTAPLMVALALLAFAGGALALAGLWQGPLWRPVAGAALCTFALLEVSFWALTESAYQRSGDRIAAFCAQAQPLLPAQTPLAYFDPECSSVRVHLRRLAPDASTPEIAALIAQPRWAILTRRRRLPQLEPILGPDRARIALESEWVEDAHSTLILLLPAEGG